MRWSYKTIHYELKKEGILGSAFLDEPEIELSLNQYGKAGWELVSLLETMDGVIAVFKQPLDLKTRSFTSSSVSTERTGRLQKGPEKKTKDLEPKSEPKDRKNDLEILDEDVAEAMLLDEFEVVEDSVEETDDKPAAQPVDVGLIRIE
ncbi:MAG: DUF4177 domain-containing protein [Desulfobulbaceae bacterium]|nr:DUF4177 domain-containing protein [Desulfobulbaceae bacterium]